MLTLESIMDELKSKGKEKTREILIRHGLPGDRMFGVSNADLKLIAKTIKGRQDLALELYSTGNVDAMYLAGIIANGAKMTRQQLNAWAEGAAGMPMISEYTVPWVALDHPERKEVAMEWIDSSAEHIASSGWCTYYGLIATQANSELDYSEIKVLLNKIVSDIHRSENRVRSNMNSFMIGVGVYIEPLLEAAQDAAQRVGVVTVDMGKTACKVPSAVTALANVDYAGRASQKRKTMRC